MKNALVFISSMLITLFINPLIYNMLARNNCLALNFRKQKIPIGMGLVFIIVQTFIISFVNLYEELKDNHILLYIISLLMIGLVGIIDDLVGEKDIKGFKGHINSLVKKQLTTGGLKLIIGGILGILLSMSISLSIFEFIVNVLIIGLFTNLINLFDLRPGRASKVFILLALLLLFSASTRDYDFIILSMFGIIFIYLPYDLKAKSMMGDAGSNILGITLGFFCVFTQSFWTKLLYLGLIVFIHIISEYYSISKIIANNKFLCYIDKLGS